MGDMVASFIRAKHIDSFQKLCFLLFLHQHPDLIGTSQEFAERLYLGDVQLLEEIITDLQMGHSGELCACYHCSRRIVKSGGQGLDLTIRTERKRDASALFSPKHIV